ncbi:MAG: hypothetical protein LBP22_15020 [Deltaproteobacteria bacterium]|jgi:hypothetical protein|nr:hypothetical protein [Deltaproteobacteria bacterium]
MPAEPAAEEPVSLTEKRPSLSVKGSENKSPVKETPISPARLPTARSADKQGKGKPAPASRSKRKEKASGGSRSIKPDEVFTPLSGAKLSVVIRRVKPKEQPILQPLFPDPV